MAGTPESPRDAALCALGTGDGPLLLGGIAAEELAERCGTPLYAYDAAVVRARLAAVRAAFGDGVGVLFACKANPSLALARLLRSGGAGIEVASAGEIALARAAGFAGTEIQCAGPAKSDLDLTAALDAGARVHLESAAEHDRLAALAAARGVRPEVAVRVQLGTPPAGARLRMADHGSRFGVPRDQVAALAAEVRARGACALVGLHQHAGSQQFDAEAWLAGAAELLTIAGEVEAAIGEPLASLNFGGGFGWPVHDGDPQFDLARAGAGLRALCGPRERQLWIEPGRTLVAPAGVYLTRVVDTKQSDGTSHALLDGGMHHCAAAAGIGGGPRRAYPIVLARAPRADTGLARVSLGGPLCTPADRFGRGLLLPPLAPGDVVAVLAAGAYALSLSPVGFLGHPTPAEVLVEDGAARIIREPGKAADVLRGQHP